MERIDLFFFAKEIKILLIKKTNVMKENTNLRVSTDNMRKQPNRSWRQKKPFFTADRLAIVRC